MRSSAHPGQLSSLAHALISPSALVRLPRRSWVWLLVYLLLCGALLGGVAWLLQAYQGRLESMVLGYVLPDSWHFAAKLLISHLLAEQHRLIIINAVTTASLVAVTLLLFPVKELLSASYEERGNLLAGEPVSEHPLWEQGWQEVKLLGIFIAVQGSIFWLGYLPYRSTEIAAIVLGYLFIFFTFAIDFISPILQRHRGYYSQILKLLALRLPASLAFGALFAAPVLIVGQLWQANPEWPMRTAIAAVFIANVVGVVWAAVAGTWLGARLYPVFITLRRSILAVRIVVTVLFLALLSVNGYLFGSLALSVHHKSQILKCDYQVDLSSFTVETPGLSALLADQVEIAVSVDVTIHNPTPFDVDIEENEVVIEHRGAQVATSSLSPLTVSSKATIDSPVRFSLSVKPSLLREGRALLEPAYWQLTLYVDITPRFRMPIYLLRASKL